MLTSEQFKSWNPLWEKAWNNSHNEKCENVKRVRAEDEDILSTSAKRDCGDKAKRINSDID